MIRKDLQRFDVKRPNTRSKEQAELLKNAMRNYQYHLKSSKKRNLIKRPGL